MKRKLLFAAMTLIAGAWSLSANAQQQDVTATYLTNADFSSGTPIDNNVCTYGKDMAANNTTYYGAQTIDGWTNASVGSTDNGYDNCTIAGALFAYGGTPWLGGSGNTAPATGPDGNAGNAAGLESVWSGSVQYTQDVTLPAGSYTVVFKVYNKTTGSGNSSGVITSNLFGFVEDGGTTHFAPNNTFAIGQWVNVAVTFELSAETAGKISMGYKGPGGNAAMPHLFVDNVKILKNAFYTDKTSSVNSTGWSGVNDGYQGGSINTARNYNTLNAQRILYQTVSGLDNGTYEVTLYSISQKEWNGTLANDAGDVAYVFAEGAYELKEWMNARARAGYPGDDNVGLYTISGVKVTDGTLTIGMGTAQPNLTQWHHIQIKSLIYTNGVDLSDYAEALQLAVDAANGLMGKIPAAAYNEIDAVVTANNQVYTTVEDYQAATAAINAAIATYGSDTMQANYAEYKTFVAAINALKAVAVTADTEATKTTNTSTLESAMSDINTAVEAVTDNPADITTQIPALKAAGKAYINGLVPADPDNAPFDMTFLIVNPTFANNNTEGWSGDTNKVGFGQQCGNAEFYEKEFDIYQTLTDMPKATYQLKVKAFNRPGWADAVIPAYVNAEDKADGTYGTHSVIYVNAGQQAIFNAASAMNTAAKGGNESSAAVGGTTYYIPNDMICANTYFAAGLYDNSVAVLCTTGTIKFGFKSVETHVGGDWTIFDDFRLYMTGALDLSAYQAELDAAVLAAQGVAEGTVPAAAYTYLQNAITTYNKTYETADEYSEAISAVNNATDAVLPLTTSYAAWKDVKAEAETAFASNAHFTSLLTTQSTSVEAVETIASEVTITDATTAISELLAPVKAWNEMKAFADYNVDATSDDDAAQQDFAIAIASAETAVNAATTANEVTAATTQLKSDMITYVNGANPTGSSDFNLTFMLTNPDVTDFWTGAWWVQPEGWYNEQNGGNFQVMANEKLGPGGEVFMEYWNENPAQSGFVLCQKVTLPAGTYKMAGRVAANFDGQSGTVQNVFFAANDALGTQITSETLIDAETEFVNTADGTEVKIGMVATSGNQARWMAINKIQLFKVPAQTYAVGAVAWDPTTAGAGDVTIARPIKVGYNAFILPFSMTQAEVEATFGTGSQVKLVKEFDSKNAIVKFSTREGIAPNEPCLINATVAADAGIVVEGRTIVAATTADEEGKVVYEGTGLTMTGCYADETNVPQYGLFVQNAQLIYNEGNGEGDSYVYSTRTYIVLDGWVPTTTNGIKGLTIIDDDEEATGIAIVENGQLNILNGKVYDLSGRAVKNPTKGLYIIDGKKVFLK